MGTASVICAGFGRRHPWATLTPMPERTRRRRSADESQARILEAAQRHLREVGPGGLRLKDLGAELGISHQAILHHFGSKERLIAAVVERTFDEINADLLAGIQAVDPVDLDAEALLDRAFTAVAEGGQARLFAWLALSGEELGREDDTKPLAQLAAAMHALRVQHHGAGEAPSEEDSRFVVVLAALAVLGESVFGDQLLRGADLEGDAGAKSRFREWLGRLLLAHLDRR